MSVTKYKDRNGRALWQLDIWISLPDGRHKRIRKSKIPTREMALALERKLKTQAFEGEWFDKRKANTLTVEKAWENYEPVSKRTNKNTSYLRNRSIATHLVKHLGHLRAINLTQGHIDAYRAKREKELFRGTFPTSGTLNREVALLKRLLNYAVKAGTLTQNPIAHVEMLRENNVRHVAINEAEFQRLYQKAEDALKPILLIAYETGMRRGEILNLRWKQVSLKEGVIHLTEADTKSSKPRLILLTDRVLAALEALPRSIKGHVFFNPDTGKRWYDIKKVFHRARTEAGLTHIRFHDLRRSFVTNARKRGISESVVMRMSGHKTRSVFERYNVVDETDLREARSRLEAGRNSELKAIQNAE